MSNLAYVLVLWHLEKKEDSVSVWGHFRRWHQRVRKNKGQPRRGGALGAIPQSRAVRGPREGLDLRAQHLSGKGPGPSSWSLWNYSHRLAAIRSRHGMVILCWPSRDGETVVPCYQCAAHHLSLCGPSVKEFHIFIWLGNTERRFRDTGKLYEIQVAVSISEVL